MRNLVEPRIVEYVSTAFVDNARTGNRGGEPPRSGDVGSGGESGEFPHPLFFLSVCGKFTTV